VSSVAEALELRDDGLDAEILAPVSHMDAAVAAERDIRPLTDDPESRDDADSRDLGVGVYGLATPDDAATEPVMTLTAEVVAVKRVTAGTGVSYGYTYRAPADTAIALVSIGYADGVPRLGSNTASASLAGIAYPVVGRIAMDQLVLDIGHTRVSPGDTATLFGRAERGEPTARDWALRTRRPPEALTASLGRRVRRIIADD
jgi:alanine racemase